MKFSLDDTVAVVTGASSGLGEAMARQLAPRARVLILVARRVDRLEALARELRTLHTGTVEVRPCDLSDPDSARSLITDVEEFHGRIDVLINNAGMGDLRFFVDSESAKNEQMIAVNVVGLTVLTGAVLPGMVSRGRGAILNVSSIAGLFWSPTYAVYGATKHYVSAFTEALRTEVCDSGVVVTLLCPGPLDTEFVAVAGNPFGMDPPPLILVTPTACARKALRALEANRARVIPGLLSQMLTCLIAVTPNWILRPIFVLMARIIRRRMRKAEAVESTSGKP